MLQPYNVLVVYQLEDADSLELANYYKAARNIPDRNVLGISFSGYNQVNNGTDLNTPWAVAGAFGQALQNHIENNTSHIAAIVLFGRYPDGVNDILDNASYQTGPLRFHSYIQDLGYFNDLITGPGTYTCRDTRLDRNVKGKRYSKWTNYHYSDDSVRPDIGSQDTNTPNYYIRQAVPEDGLSFAPFFLPYDEWNPANKVQHVKDIIDSSIRAEQEVKDEFGICLLDKASLSNMVSKMFWADIKTYNDPNYIGGSYDESEVYYNDLDHPDETRYASDNQHYIDATPSDYDPNNWAKEQRMGHPNFISVNNVALRSAGSKNYYLDNIANQPENSSHYTYKDGAIVVVSQSYGSKALPQRCVSWDDLVDIETSTSKEIETPIWQPVEFNDLVGAPEALFELRYRGASKYAKIEVTATPTTLSDNDPMSSEIYGYLETTKYRIKVSSDSSKDYMNLEWYKDVFSNPQGTGSYYTKKTYQEILDHFSSQSSSKSGWDFQENISFSRSLTDYAGDEIVTGTTPDFPRELWNNVEFTNAHGVKEPLFQFKYTGADANASIEVTSNEIRCLADSQNFIIPYDSLQDTVRDFSDNVYAEWLVNGSDWDFRPEPNRAVSRAYAAYLNGACLTYGVTLEPYNIGDSDTSGLFPCFRVLRETAGDWAMKWLDSSQGDTNIPVYIRTFGDPLLRVFGDPQEDVAKRSSSSKTVNSKQDRSKTITNNRSYEATF